MPLNSYSYSIIGGRRENQDAVGSREDGSRGLYVVADGLGGHDAGRVAADCAVAALLKNWVPETALSKERMAAAIGRANAAILHIQRETGLETKSTVVALAVRDDQAIWANTGDSRLYHIRDGRVAAHTADQSLAYKKYRLGMIRWEDIPYDADQNLLLRALGNEIHWKPHVYPLQHVRPGDGFLLCSDGLWELLRDGEIADDCAAAEDAEDWGRRLIERVEARMEPGHDNVSFIAVKLTAE